MLKYISNTFFSKKLDFRVRLFNILAIAGVAVSLASAAAAFALGEPAVTAILYLCFAVLSAGLLIYSAKSGRYQLCYMITIIVIFLIGFPIFFFMTGAYFGTLPYFFIFAVVFTVFMLEGKTALATAAIELIVYAALCIHAFGRYTPDEHYLTSRLIVIDTIFSFVIVSAALGICIFLHFRLYNRQQRELEAAWEESKRHSEVKNVFLANMSHEIRTPINVMLGMTEMVLRDSPDETVRGYARKIQNAGNMLLVLVSNLLDVSKIESGKFEMAQARYRLTSLIQELYEAGSESARKKGLSFSVEVDETLPSALWGDLLRIRQIVTNFLSNASKYTRSGSIILKFSRKATDISSVIKLRVSVTDTGIGIKKENQPVLFNAFTRGDQPPGSYIEGTGLGLAIAKDLTALMGGNIGMKSEFGDGSEFWVEIPQIIMDDKPVEDWQTAAESADTGLEESFTAPAAAILIVDDNKENLQTIEILLRRTLVRVDMVESGAACLEAVRNSDYNVILMDYMMPGMDGAETLRRLREDFPEFSAPVIALTANAVAGVEERLLADGFAAYVTKPVQARVLEELLAAHLPPALVSRRVIHPPDWAGQELLETLARDLDAYGVSLADGLRNASGDLSLLARMADIFTHDYEDSLLKMRHACPDDHSPSSPDGVSPFDPDEFRRLVHSLKSRAGFIGALELQSTALLLEQECVRCYPQDEPLPERFQPGEFSHVHLQPDNDETYIGRGAIALATPLLYLLWDRAQQGLKAFAAHVHAIEPRPPRKAEDRGFSRERFTEYIDRRLRRRAILELDKLAEDMGGVCPPAIADVKTALEALDFTGAKQLFEEWEARRS